MPTTEHEQAVATAAVGIITAYYTLPKDEATPATRGLVEDLVAVAVDDTHRGFLLGQLVVSLGEICATGAHLLDSARPELGSQWLKEMGQGVASWR
ncbi:hypothetical protein [Sphaerisporangium rhizosphaerae]|uniref:Uncharacterized protein n=1 Tax=Sphaerisporangium rhizosphaerae TaxID=2269375 RepID=A0ABW2NZN2_9ACTN